MSRKAIVGSFSWVMVGFAAVAILIIAGPAHALRFDFGAGSYVETSGTHEALRMSAVVNPELDDVSFDLAPGASSGYIHFATLWTNESWINEDDLHPGNVVAHVDFDNPDVPVAVAGESIGFSAWSGFTQGWSLRWDDPVYVATGGGLFALELSDVHYASWFWQGPDGSGCRPGRAQVYAKVTCKSTSVPDASILFLLGPALAGLGILGRRKALH